MYRGYQWEQDEDGIEPMIQLDDGSPYLYMALGDRFVSCVLTSSEDGRNQYSLDIDDLKSQVEGYERCMQIQEAIASDALRVIQEQMTSDDEGG